MELVPIIESSLLIFSGILLLVLLFSYISYKLGNTYNKTKAVPVYTNQVMVKKPVINTDEIILQPIRNNQVNQKNDYYHYITHKYEQPFIQEVRRSYSADCSERFVVVNQLLDNYQQPQNHRSTTKANYKFIV